MAALAPAIDYTDKDFAALRRAMLDLARYRLPEWTDRSEADLGVLLIDLFAYMGDVVLYYQDRIANESFLHTATERHSVLHLLRLIGYELRPPVAAYADLQLVFNTPGPGEPSVVTIPNGAQFATKGSPVQTFQYLGPTLQLDVLSSQTTALPDGRRSYTGLPVRHSRSVADETLGSSTGEPNQRFQLAQSPLIPESLAVQVLEGGIWVEWRQQDNFLYSTGPDGQVTVSNAEARSYYVQNNENDRSFVCFGDGLFSRIPPLGVNNLRASYRTGGGLAGNVPTGTIVEARPPLPLLDSVTNPQPAAGGAERESTEHGVRFGPLAFRSTQRAVTLNDFVALAHQAGGVAKVRARPRAWNRVDLYIAPEGEVASLPPESLKRRLVAYFEHKRMVGAFVAVQDPTLVPIDVGVEVVVEHSFSADRVRQSVESAVRGLLAFANVDFGQHLYLSKVYEAVEALPGVYAATVTRFSRYSAEMAAFEADLAALIAAGVTTIPESVRRAVKSGLNAEGRIDIGEYEIPTPGAISVTLVEELSS